MRPMGPLHPIDNVLIPQTFEAFDKFPYLSVIDHLTTVRETPLNRPATHR